MKNSTCDKSCQYSFIPLKVNSESIYYKRKKIINDRYFSGFHLAGFIYHQGVAVFQELKVGATLTMVAERDNNFDPYAVALYYGDRKLGYVPRSENRHISQLSHQPV